MPPIAAPSFTRRGRTLLDGQVARLFTLAADGSDPELLLEASP